MLELRGNLNQGGQRLGAVALAHPLTLPFSHPLYETTSRGRTDPVNECTLRVSYIYPYSNLHNLSWDIFLEGSQYSRAYIKLVEQEEVSDTYQMVEFGLHT